MVERISLLQICDQRLFLCLIFENVRQSSDSSSSSSSSIIILMDCFLWYSLNSEVDFELLLIRDWFPDARTTLKSLIVLDLPSFQTN